MAGNDPPDRPLSYASMTKGRISKNVKAYADLVAKHKKERNMIEIKFTRMKKQNDLARPNRNVEIDTVSEYVFGELNVNPNDILEVDLNTGKGDTKQILFKPGVNTDSLVSNFPDTFGEFNINISKISNTEKRVSFKNVPSYVPDEEILNLCAIYGDVEGGVQREKVSMKTASGSISLVSSNRFVMIKIKPGYYFNNYYWMEGPLPGDQGRRITVLHSGQPQQCSFCLDSVETGCLGFGNGRKCEEMGGVRKKMSSYMQEFKERTGYL